VRSGKTLKERLSVTSLFFVILLAASAAYNKGTDINNRVLWRIVVVNINIFIVVLWRIVSNYVLLLLLYVSP